MNSDFRVILMRRISRFIWLGAAFGILGGCAAPAQYTKVDDPFKSLSHTKAQRPYASAKLCLMLTENTNRAMEHIADVRNMGARWGASVGEFEPKRLVADITDTLNTRFREIVRVHSLDESKSQGCNVVLAFELQVVIGTLSFQDVSVAMAGTLADDKGNRLDTVSGSGKGTLPWPNIGPGGVFSDSWNKALAAFGDGLDGSQPLITYVAGLPKYIEPGTTIAAPSVAPANIDLAFWDSVKDSTSPGDLQAYLRKFPNGSFESLARSRLVALGEPLPARAKPIGQPANGKTDFGNYHALVIGNNNYRSVTPLKTAALDAKEVAEELKKHYGFKVTLLVDATRNQTLDVFDDLRRTLTDNDNLLIYYAGHGYLDAESDRGFWLPVDADPNRRANWLSNSDLADMVRATRAKHVLVVADSCYAGTLTRSLSVQMSGLDDLSRLAQKRARTALTSGGLEPVEDSGGGKHSIFAKAFLGALRANAGVADMSQIFSAMRREVILGSQQTPQYGDIRQTGHEGGDFIFVRGKTGN
jgi:hypothetical protein